MEIRFLKATNIVALVDLVSWFLNKTVSVSNKTSYSDIVLCILNGNEDDVYRLSAVGFTVELVKD